MAKDIQITLLINTKGALLKTTAKQMKDVGDQTKKTDAATKKYNKTQESTYNRQKQGVVQTANSTKNFSKLSQTVDGGGGGPGGLVRAYALLAANVFALTAAFGVLSRSAQIDTLHQSMEVLSTSGGTYIKNVAKEMQIASGHAIDLAQSFRQVSLASSAGLNTAEIEGLTAVAKGAAISLGRNLPDAMDRIFRGAIKLEPEILDEIGLFVRVDEAAQKYARNNGKVVSALTQVEKRQAFLNEILEQGTKKFQQYAEEIKPDPYVRLGAALSDIAQGALSMLNDVLGPFLGMLAESKGLLTVVFGGLVALLMKKAIPAMGLMTRTSAEAANEAAENAKKYTETLNTQLTQEAADHDKNLKKKLKNAKKHNKDMFKQTGPQSKAAGAKDLKNELKQNQTLTRLKKKHKELDAQILNKRTSHANRKLLEKDKENLEKIIEKKQRIANLEQQIQANQQKGAIIGANSAAARQQERLDRNKFETGAVATATGVGETQGWAAGRAELYEQLDKEYKGMDKSGKETQKTLSRTRKGITAFKGEVSLATGQINKMMAMMGPWIMLFTMVTAAIGMTAKWLGIGDERSQKFNETMKQADDLMETVNQRFHKQAEAIHSNTLSYRELNKAALAYSNTQVDLGNSLQKLENDFNSWLDSATGAAKFWDRTLEANAQVADTPSTMMSSNWLAKGFRGLLGEGKKADKEKKQKELAQEMIGGALKQEDSSGLKIWTDIGIDIGFLTDKTDEYTVAQEAASKANEALVNSQKTMTRGQREQIALKERTLGIMLQEHKEGKEMRDSHKKTLAGWEKDNELLFDQFHAKKNLHDANEKLDKSLIDIVISQAQVMFGGEKFTENAKKQVDATKALESALTGASEAMGKFNQSFMPKTKVDDIVSTFDQINATLAGKDKIEMGSGREEYFKNFLEDDNPLRGLVASSIENEMKDGKVIGKKLKDGLLDTFKASETGKALSEDLGRELTKGDFIEHLFKSAEKTVEEYRKTLILAKLEIDTLSKAQKQYNKLAAGGLEVNIKEQTALLNIQKKKTEIAKAETDIMLVNYGFGQENMRDGFKTLQTRLAMAELEGATETRKQILQEYDLSELDMLTMKAAFMAEDAQILEEKIKNETHLLDAQKQKLQGLNKQVQAEKELNNQIQNEIKLNATLKAMSRGTSTLNPAQEAALAVDAAKRKLDMTRTEAKIKFLLLDIEQQILLARIAVLEREGELAGVQVALLRQNITTASNLQKQAMRLVMKNAALQFGVDIQTATLKGLSGGFGKGIGMGMMNLMTELDTINSKFNRTDPQGDAVKAGYQNIMGTPTGVGGDVDKEFEQFDLGVETSIKAQEQAAITRHAMGVLRNSVNETAKAMMQLGPEGEAAAAFATGTMTIVDNMFAMTDTLDIMTEKGASSMTKIAEVASFVGGALGNIGQMIMANSKAQVAEIDKQIEAEKNRDGKSAASVAKMKALEAKKHQMAKKAFDTNKKIQMASVAINTAAAIMQVMAAPGDFYKTYGLPMSIAIAAMGAAQLALISKSQYSGGPSSIDDATPTSLTIGGRGANVDVSQRAGAGELSYLRGEKGTGTNANNFRTGGATGIRGYATGQPLMVGEQGPERIDIIPNEDLGKSTGATNINFNISAVDGQSVQNMLQDQQGNIISMIREAANDNGEFFLENVDSDVYGSASTGGG